MREPIFEIRYQDSKRFKIYENGKIEGFPDGAIIFNHIPARISEVQANCILSDSCPSKKETS
jgi:hypothetical protein